MDEPEALGSIARLAFARTARHLIFVVNCNLQRLDGPVRGNGKIIPGAGAILPRRGWNVIKLIWGHRLGSADSGGSRWLLVAAHELNRS